MIKLHPGMLKIRDGKVVLDDAARMLIARAVLEEGQKVDQVAHDINIPRSRALRVIRFYKRRWKWKTKQKNTSSKSS